MKINTKNVYTKHVYQLSIVLIMGMIDRKSNNFLFSF